MSDSGLIGKFKQQWKEMDPKFKYAIGAIIICGAILVMLRSNDNKKRRLEDQEHRLATVPVNLKGNQTGHLPNGGNTFTVLPNSSRNQGMEDLLASMAKASADARQAQDRSTEFAESVRRLTERLSHLEGRAGGTLFATQAANGAARQSGAVPGGSAAPYENLPPVDFGQPGPRSTEKNHDGSPFGEPAHLADLPSPQLSRTTMRVWGAEAQAVQAEAPADKAPPLAIPINSAIESVMLNGINARSNSAGGGASGTILSANNVGSPFVTRVKGNAILPNGWKVSDFNDCFISGTGIAILSSERANVISNVMSCIDKKGNVHEAAIKAYGVDLDGIQGISGRVVTKQGALLAKTALAGVASGLGNAFAPSALPSYNQNAQSGDRQGIQYPNPGLVAGSALGGGVNEAGRSLAKFYLDYAKEMFPVIEVAAGTRITWILQETVELNMTTKTKAK